MGAFTVLALLTGSLVLALVDNSNEEPETSVPPEEQDEGTPDLPTKPQDPPVTETPGPAPETPTVPETPTQPDSPNVLEFTGQQTIIGTQGDDVLITEDREREDSERNSLTTEVNLRGGDDSFEGDAVFDSRTVRGGDGNDTLISGGTGHIFFGGEGDDVLRISSQDEAYGGPGSDTLSWGGDAGNDGGGLLDGGAGDDQFDIFERIGRAPDPFDNSGAATFVGGTGVDTYNLTLELGTYASQDGEVPEEVQENLVSRNDFVAGEDVFLIDVTRAAGEEGRALVSAEMVPGSFIGIDETIETTNLVMTFDGSEDQPRVVASIRFLDTEVTLNDIQFVTN